MEQARLAAVSGATLITLAYHRVHDMDTLEGAPSLVSASPAQFEAQMRYVAHRYNVVSSRDVVRALRGEKDLPPRALSITFDDGYLDNYQYALPVLRRLNFPATLFVPTLFPGSPGALFWWDALYHALMHTEAPRIVLEAAPASTVLPLGTREERRAAFDTLVPVVERQDEKRATQLVDSILEQCDVAPPKRRLMMSWGEIRDMSENGVDIGPHSRSHIVLAQADRERVRMEVEGSWADLKARIPSAVPLFCYPVGKPHAVNRAVAASVRRSGLAGAYTMVAGRNVVGRTNPYLLHRIGIEPARSIRTFAFKISPAATLYRRVKTVLSRRAAAQARFN